MSNNETHEQDSPRRWTDLLSVEDKQKLQEAYRKLFPQIMADGYVVVDELGVSSGKLLSKGRYVGYVQSHTAGDIIAHLEHHDMMAELHGWDLPLPTEKTRYMWQEQALVPPRYWEERTNLTIDDIKLDTLGITIFTKKVQR